MYSPTAVAGAFRIEPERREDSRGFFARVWCEREMAEHGLNTRVAQSSVSFTRQRGTIRGLHLQLAPNAEVKLVRCIRGAIFDVVVDLRPDSPTYLQHATMELTGENRLAFYIPEGCAHGFQTLTDDVEVLYQMSEFYAPESARGVRWNDPAFGIRWPITNATILDRDASYPDFTARTFA